MKMTQEQEKEMATQIINNWISMNKGLAFLAFILILEIVYIILLRLDKKPYKESILKHTLKYKFA